MSEHPFTQAVLWPGCILPAAQVPEFEEFILKELGARAKFIGSYKTLPDAEPDSGGREDVLFYVHEEDISGFSVKRLALGMRWVEDVLDNEKRRNEGTIYVQEIHDLYSWDRS